MNPEFEDEEPMNPFDMWEGANFKLKIRNVEGYRNYDKSEFDKPSAISNDDDELEAIWRQTHPLAPILAPENYKSYDELKRKLDQVLGLGAERTPAHARAEARDRPSIDEDDLPFDVGPSSKSVSNPAFGSADDDDDDDSMSFFQKLAED